MKLSELAFACYVYSRMTDYDISYRAFREGTRPQLDLQQEQHVKLLLKWLNDWGCRQFAKEYHDLAGKDMSDWHRGVADQLFPIDAELLSLSDKDFAVVERAFAGLIHRIACKRMLAGGKESAVDVGPTGAAKILFALRPNALIPWDVPMRAEFNLDGTAHSYVTYLRRVKAQIESLRIDCVKYGLRISDLPRVLGRPDSSLTKLIDEYHWVTVSRNCPAPPQSELRRWGTWE